MNSIDKFYSDITRCTKDGQDACAEKFLTVIKTSYTDLEELSLDLVSVWKNARRETMSAKETAEYFYKLFCFLTDELQAGEDFSEEEWYAIYDSVIAVENDLDIDMLQKFFAKFLEKGIM